jgi:hypothetical protein
VKYGLGRGVKCEITVKTKTSRETIPHSKNELQDLRPGPIRVLNTGGESLKDRRRGLHAAHPSLAHRLLIRLVHRLAPPHVHLFAHNLLLHHYTIQVSSFTSTNKAPVLLQVPDRTSLAVAVDRLPPRCLFLCTKRPRMENDAS